VRSTAADLGVDLRGRQLARAEPAAPLAERLFRDSASAATRRRRI
jgi:hypothetical protein